MSRSQISLNLSQSPNLTSCTQIIKIQNEIILHNTYTSLFSFYRILGSIAITFINKFLNRFTTMKRKVIENYTLCEVLGEGSFGKVYKALHNKTNQQFAIKMIPIQKFKQNSRLEECSANEIKNLTRIEQNPYIIKFIEMLKTPNNFYFVYQFCNGKTLEAKLKQEIKLSEKQALKIFSQLLEAFKILNKYNIMHRDLKPDNIFFHNGDVKLGDFGFCKTLLREGDMTSTMLGSPIYMAPEVLRGQIYTSKADIWSLGVVLYQMLFGVCPFQSNSIAKLIAVLDNMSLKFPQQINPISLSTQTLLKKMLTKDQFKRVDWFQLLTIKVCSEPKYSDQISTPKNSTNRSIIQLEKRIQQFGRTNLSSSARVPLSCQTLNSPVSNLDFLFKKKSESTSKPNPESQNFQIVKANSMRVNQQSNVSSASTSGSYRKIDSFPKVQFSIESQPTIQRRFSFPAKMQTKRRELLSQHNSCLMGVRTALGFMKSTQIYSPVFAYLIFKKVDSTLRRMIDCISSSQFQLEDILGTISHEIILFQKQLFEIEGQLKNVGIDVSCLVSARETLKERYTTESNKRLWYQMIVFLKEQKENQNATQIQWNSVINGFLL